VTRPAIGFAGMSHLGVVSAAAAAERGFAVTCFDSDGDRIEAFDRGRLPLVEPDLPDVMARNRARLRFSVDPADLAGCAVVYVAEDVPTDEQGLSTLDTIVTLAETVGRTLSPQACLVVLSQVPPGFTRSLDVVPPSRRFYQVETLIFGRAMERALRPERVIIGSADPSALLPAPLGEFLGAFGCPILPMTYESAELAKIAINLLLVASIGMTNTLAELCERIGANWHEIAPALRLDARIGRHAYLSPGLGLAGGNLDRDLTTARALADRYGVDDSVVRACQANSRIRRNWVLNQVHARVIAHRRDPVLGVLGLAYKADTAATRDSPALGLLAALPNVRIQCYDPVVPIRSEYHARAVAAPSALAVCDGADAVAIMTPWPEFRSLSPAAMAEAMRGRVVIDPYGMLDAAACQAVGLDHVRLGVPFPNPIVSSC
jgi:UDPglucose 6-dehydrogenase